MLKVIYPSILRPLWILFNKSLSAGEFPEDMRLAIIKAKNKHEISNYRPISILPVISIMYYTRVSMGSENKEVQWMLY